jgi:hypothetical protein
VVVLSHLVNGKRQKDFVLDLAQMGGIRRLIVNIERIRSEKV